MYPFDTLVNAGKIVEVPRRADFSLDIDRLKYTIRETKPKIIFLATPNNPDGSMLDPVLLEELLSFPVLVVLDEAYIEFSEDGTLGSQATQLHQVLNRDNLIVLRTFSKWAGLAGLRVGFGCFPQWIMPVLWKAKQPYNVNVAASEAAIAALADVEYIGKTVALLCKERQHLMRELAEIPYLKPYPSKANFILCKVFSEKHPALSAAVLKTELANQYGILVRYFDKPGLQDHIRISVGKPEHTAVWPV
jgi:histidinol-phosphate aminotransferase